MTRRDRVALTVVAVAVALAAYWFLLFAPKREEAARLQGQVAQQRQRLQTAEANLAASQAARSSYAANYTAVARLGKAVPADDDVRSLVVQLDAAAQGTGVDFRTIEVGGGSGASAPVTPASATPGAASTTQALPPGAVTVGTAGFSAMPFSFGFRGTFRNLSEFFTRLERFVTVQNDRISVTGRLLRLERVTLEPEDAAAGLGRIRASIGASSYLVPPTQGVTGGATSQGPVTATPAATPAPSGGSTPPATTASATGATR